VRVSLWKPEGFPHKHPGGGVSRDTLARMFSKLRAYSFQNGTSGGPWDRDLATSPHKICGSRPSRAASYPWQRAPRGCGRDESGLEGRMRRRFGVS